MRLCMNKMQFTYLMADTVYMRMASTRQSQNGNDIYSLVGFYDREGVSFAFAHHHHHHNQTIEPPIQPAPERGHNTSFFFIWIWWSIWACAQPAQTRKAVFNCACLLTTNTQIIICLPRRLREKRFVASYIVYDGRRRRRRYIVVFEC